jgi:hypothetical protein
MNNHQTDSNPDWIGAMARIMNANLADFHVPVNAGIGGIDVSAIDLPVPQLDSLGAQYRSASPEPEQP